ncbi:MAG TPA: response regulator, partial [Aquabacterium sp.]|nr:response regulator [Aquabacterium sp.]
MSSHTDDIVYLVDDEAVVRDALAFLLGSRGLLVYSFASGPALLAHLVQAVRPVRGVFLVDVRMEPMSGLLLHEELLAQGIRNPLLFLSGHGDIPMVVESLKKGAFDFLEKPYSDNTLVDRIEQALAVERAMLVDDARHAEKGARLASLSDREREV